MSVRRRPGRAFEASLPATQRYPPAKQREAVMVVVDGRPCPAVVIGRNGPRVQLGFVRDDAHFVRWFDTDQLIDIADVRQAHEVPSDEPTPPAA